MNIIVPIKLVPDLVEELKLNDTSTALDPDWLRFKLNEFDDHAVEQAILLKEKGAGQVVVVALDGDGVDDVLFTTAAKGADRVIKLGGMADQPVNNHALARSLVPVIRELSPGLVLTGVQAHNDLDGTLGPLLAEYLGFPFVGYVSGVTLTNGIASLRKEFAGGLVAEVETGLPVVLGIQAAETPPRYVAFSKIRQMMKSVQIEERMLETLDLNGGPSVDRLFMPESGERAQMLEGSVDDVAGKMVEIFSELGIV
jgi:electron transfer flavoprotein beta subunit